MIIRMLGRIVARQDGPATPDELVAAGRYAEVSAEFPITGIRFVGALKVDADVLQPGCALGTKTLVREIGLLGRRFATAEELLLIAARHPDLFGHPNLIAMGDDIFFRQDRLEMAMMVYRNGEDRCLRVLWTPEIWTPDHRILTVMK
jgi:hypothetical protein